jgi:hypothetical protein
MDVLHQHGPWAKSDDVLNCLMKDGVMLVTLGSWEEVDSRVLSREQKQQPKVLMYLRTRHGSWPSIRRVPYSTQQVRHLAQSRLLLATMYCVGWRTGDHGVGRER